jgi:hypothetical protein
VHGGEGIFAIDLDGDGDADVLSASRHDDKIAWYKNQGGGQFGPQQIISKEANYPRSVHAADLDGDGDADVLSASRHDHKIAWYKNQGGGQFGPQQIISEADTGAYEVMTVDMDGDGDQDVLSVASGNISKISWFRNGGRGNFELGQVIDRGKTGSVAVHAADLDGDGDQDVISTHQSGESTGRTRHACWWENNGPEGFSKPQLLSRDYKNIRGVHAADLTGDGLPDIIVTDSANSTVGWLENRLDQ